MPSATPGSSSSSLAAPPLVFTSYSSEETQRFGAQLLSRLTSSAVVAFHGELGSGKTTCIKGLVAAASGLLPEEVLSPTFVYLQAYETKISLPIYHFDLYRLHDAEEFIALGFEEYLLGTGICCLEWSERILSLLPPHTIHVFFSHKAPTIREIRTGL